MRIQTFTTFLGALALGGLLACGGGGGASASAGSSGGNGGNGGGGGTPTVSVVVNPATASVPAGGTQQFAATVTGNANTAVTWSTDAGTVSAAGLFTAPASATVAHVKATSQADANASATATVTVTAAEAVTITPSNPSLSAGSKLQFTATTTSGGGVLWSASAGSISGTGLFTAPAAAGSCIITATSVSDGTKKGSTTVTVTAATGTVIPAPQLPVLAWKERSDWVNVKTNPKLAKHAVGDGVADDTAALQAAFDLISNRSNQPDPKPKVVFLPEGTYKITTQLNLVDILDGMVIGCGRNTILQWGGPVDDPANPYHGTQWANAWMWNNDGARQMEYTGIVFDGMGVCTYGVCHAAKSAFEAKNVYRFVHFRNFRGDGIRAGGNGSSYASSEQEYRDSIFENCRAGIHVQDANYYNHAVSNCDFYDCDYGIRMIYFGQGYVRRCHFERSRVADLDSGSPSFSFSVRECTSLGSKQFLLHNSVTNTKYVIQNCVVEGWSNMAGLLQDKDGSPSPIFDTRLLNAPSSYPPFVFTMNGGGTTTDVIFSNVSSPDTPTLWRLPAGRTAPPVISRTAPVSQLTRADVSFRTTSLDVSGKVFDARQYLKDAGHPADHTATLQKCINDAKAAGNGAVVYFPTGTYWVEGTLIVDGGGYSLEGTGFASGFNRNGSAKTPFIEVRSPQGITLRSFSAYFVGEGMTGIKQIRSTGVSSSSVLYDRVWFKAGNPVAGYAASYEYKDLLVTRKTNFDGLWLEGLSTGDRVDLKRTNGAVRINNCARATILGEFVDGCPLIIEGKESIRDGFIGFLNSNGNSLQIKDNQNFVTGDYYTEHGPETNSPYDGQNGRPTFNCISVQGAEGDPTGSVVLGQAKFQAYDTNNLFSVQNYSGLAALCFPLIDTGDRQPGQDGKPYAFVHTGNRALDLVYLGLNASNYGYTAGSGASVYQFPDKPGSGSAQVGQILDRFAAMVETDLSFNPGRNLGFVQTPTLSPAGGSFHAPVKVLLRSATDGAKIRYTTDGSEPTESHGTEVANNTLVSVDASQQLRALATKSGLTTSPSIASTFTISTDAPKQSVWPSTKVPTGSTNGGTAENGMIFTPTQDGWITGIRAYALAGESGLHLARIWAWPGFDEEGNSEVIAGPFGWTYAGTAGWVTLDIPAVPVKKGRLYVVSVSAGTDSGRLVPTIQADPAILAPGSNGQNLLYPIYPTASESADVLPLNPGATKFNYLRDVVFLPGSAAPANPPSSVPATPAAPAVTGNKTASPSLSGIGAPGQTAWVLVVSRHNGNNGQRAPIPVAIGADGKWSCTVNLPFASDAYAFVLLENDKGLSAASPRVDFTVSK